MIGVPAAPCKQERARPRRQPQMCSIGQAERNTGQGMGIASDRAKAQRAVDFSETDAKSKAVLPTPAEIGRASVQRKPPRERGKSLRGSMAASPRETSPTKLRYAADDADYDSAGWWRIGACRSRAPIIAPPHPPKASPRRVAHIAEEDGQVAVPTGAAPASEHRIRRDVPATWNGESLRFSQRQAASVRAQSSGRARRQILEQRKAEGLSSSHRTRTTGHRDHGATAGHYAALLRGHDDGSSARDDHRDDSRLGHHRDGAASTLSDTSTAAPRQRPQTAGWSFPHAPRFAQASAAVVAGTPVSADAAALNVEEGAVRRHIPGPTMRIQMPQSVFEEHKSARAASARGQRRPPSDFDSSRRHPLPNLRSCVHSRLLPASAIQ